MYFVFAGLYVIVCLLLLGVVLLQQGKGGDIAAAFGGSSSQTAFGARAGATVLTRATAILGTLFMLGAFALGVIGKGGGSSSVVSGVQGPAQTTPAAPALPMGGAPAPATTPVATPTPTTTPAGGGSTPAPAPTTKPSPTATPTPPAGRSSGS